MFWVFKRKSNTNEADLTADTTDYGASVQTGFKATIRNIIRKIKGLFQRTTENEAAIVTESSRAQTAESGLSSDIAAEATRAQTAEQNVADAVTVEATRATTAEQANAVLIQAEATRAQTAEDAIAAELTAETARATQAESNLQGQIQSEEQRALTIEGQLGERLTQIDPQIAQAIGAAENAGNIANTAMEQAQAAGSQAWQAENAAQEARQRAENAENAASNASMQAQNAENTANNAAMQAQNAEWSAQQAQQSAQNAENAANNVAMQAQNAEWVAQQAQQSAQTAENAASNASMQAQNAESAANNAAMQAQNAEWSAQQSAQNAQDSANQAISGLDNKVDKEYGKGLSTEDYTTAEKQKLAALESGGSASGTYINKGAWVSTTTYAKGEVVSVATEGVLRTLFVSLVDANLNHNPYTEYATAAPTYWQNLSQVAHTASKVSTSNPSTSGNNYLLTTTLTTVAVNTTVARNGNVYADKDGKLYDSRGILAAQSDIPSGASGDYLPLTGGEVTGDVTLKYPAKLIGSGNGQQAADWLKYDNSSNYFTIGNTGTVAEIDSLAAYVCRKNSAGSRFKFYDEGNKPTPADIGAAAAITETALTFSGIHTSISNLSGYYLKDSAAHGRIFLRLTTTASITNWTSLFTITNSEIPSGSAVGNRLGMTTTMGQSSFNGSSLISVSLGTSNGVMTGQSLSSGWDYTMVINY